MTGIVEVDVHGMNQTQAQIAIDAALRRANASVYRIRIIHGYTHNTILRDMVQYKYRNHPKVKRIAPGSNPGQTDLILRELFLNMPSRQSRASFPNISE